MDNNHKKRKSKQKIKKSIRKNAKTEQKAHIHTNAVYFVLVSYYKSQVNTPSDILWRKFIFPSQLVSIIDSFLAWWREADFVSTFLPGISSGLNLCMSYVWGQCFFEFPCVARWCCWFGFGMQLRLTRSHDHVCLSLMNTLFCLSWQRI